MPSDSSLRAFLAELSPEDVATLFAGLRSTVPLSAGFHSPELNAGEAEWVAKQRMDRDAARMREMEFINQALPRTMAKRRSMVTPGAEPDVFVPTRPRVMKESPFIATQPRATPVPQQYAEGGPVTPDHTQPDMSDGGQMIADPNLYAKGGSVFGKNLDEMQAELLSKEGMARRSLFGLRPEYPVAKAAEPLSKVEKEVQRTEQAARREGQAPSVTATRVDVDPGSGAKKSLMQSVTETPVSRRTVLKSAGSQALQHVLPVGDIAKALDVPVAASPVGAIAQAARVAPALPVTMESVIAGAIGQGMRKREVINEALRKFPGQDFADAEDVYRTLKDPYRYINFDASDIDMVEAARPADTMRGFIGAPSESPLFSIRPYMRALKQASPEVYGKARMYSKDTAESAIEDLIDRGVLRSEDEIKRFLRNDPGIYEIMGNR